MMSRDDDPIIGGDTPFIPASEAYRAYSHEHKPLHIKIEGKEATRDVNLTLCAMMWRMEETEPRRPKGMAHGYFMRSFIASANHDMRALGIVPLISMSEVEALANHPSIIAAVDK